MRGPPLITISMVPTVEVNITYNFFTKQGKSLIWEKKCGKSGL